MHLKGSAVQALPGPDLLTATSQPTTVPLNPSSCLAAPVDHVRIQGSLTSGPSGHGISGGDKWRPYPVASLRGGPSVERVDRPLLGSHHHDVGRFDSVLPHQEKGRALLRQGQPGPCGGAGGHDLPAPALHGASTWLTPFGSDGSSAPGTSSDSQHRKHRKLAGSDAVAVLCPGKPACQPAIRSEDSGSLRSPPPQPVPDGLSQIEKS